MIPAYNCLALWRGGERSRASLLNPLAFLTLRRLIIAATCLAVCYFVFAGFTGAMRHEQIDGRKDALEGEIATLEHNKSQLIALSAYLSSDEYIERAARSQLGLVRPGEVGVIIVAPAQEESPIDPSRPWWKRFFD